VYRNYFVSVGGRTGQTHDNQIDCLHDLGQALGNQHGDLWAMRNGYAMASQDGLQQIARYLNECDEQGRDALRQRLRIGIQQDTQVTLPGCTHRVSQAYCSALPVWYSEQPRELWEPFARLVLEAAYEATLYAAIVNSHRSGNPTLYLTLLGSGAFGNDTAWVMDAMLRALQICRHSVLDVIIVSYGSPNAQLAPLWSVFAD